MSFRYSLLCGTAIDAVDAMKLEIPQGFYIFESQIGRIPYHYFYFCHFENMKRVTWVIIKSYEGSGRFG